MVPYSIGAISLALQSSFMHLSKSLLEWQKEALILQLTYTVELAIVATASAVNMEHFSLHICHQSCKMAILPPRNIQASLWLVVIDA